MRIIILLIIAISHISLHGATSIVGVSEVSTEKMYQFVLTHNPNFTRDIAESYLRIGNTYNIRGDIALCQAILETGWFKFSSGTAVDKQQYNYCGLGVLSTGMQGCTFSSISDGITAQIQHLYAYATKAPIPDTEQLIDPRFNQVTRGCAPSWEDLSGHWAANDHYGERIIELYNKMCAYNEADVITIGIPDELFDSLTDDLLFESPSHQ